MAALRTATMALAASLATALVPAAALGQQAADAAQLEKLDELRAEVASQIQLLAFDLLDELVFGWTERPVFAADTPVVLAGVTVPVGLGSGLVALIENHFASLIVNNPSTRIVLSHCPECNAVIVHSGAQGTVVSRGVDAPEALAKAGGLSGSHHALFLDFEAEGGSLVLRARITAIEPTLPILFARTLSSAGAVPALLRDPEHLKSAAEARHEYLDALQGRGSFLVPVRVVVRSYAKDSSSVVTTSPFIWLTAGVETAFTQAQAWTASFSLGYTWMPDMHDGWLAEARISRLISGWERSLTEPDLYLFLGGAAISIQGQDAILFRNNPPDITNQIAEANGDKPRATFAAWQLGLNLRVKNRISAAVFLETMPAIGDSPALGNYLDLGIVEFHGMGAEVGFCF